MSIIVRTAKTLRNHWKKSVFFSSVITYGIVYTKNYVETQELMRQYCQKAAEYGKQPISVDSNPRHITIILNPSANKRKATNEFEKYCAPLLHLAGIFVDVKKTESEGHARTIVNTLGGTDAIVVAGGNGTLSEVVTGLLRNSNEDTDRLVPIGILPLGKNNNMGKKVEKVQRLADATLAVIEEAVKPADVMKIEILNDDAVKPVYALDTLKWGVYRDAEARKDKYWYFGPLRKYATYIFNGFKSSLTWNCDAVINYSLPCDGCSNCYRRVPKIQSTGWFSKFVKEDSRNTKYLQVVNPECSLIREMNICTSDLALSTSNATNLKTDETPKLTVEMGPEKVSYFEFVKNGFKIERGDRQEVKDVIEVRTMVLNPKNEHSWFSIDNEEYEVKPIRITLLPKIINMFCKKENT